MFLPRTSAVAKLPVEALQGVFLGLGQNGISADGGDELAVPRRLENAGPHVQLLGGHGQGASDLLEDVSGGLAEAALDLAEVGIGDPGDL